MTFTYDQVRSAVRTAIDCLPILEGSEHAAQALIATIANMSQPQQHNLLSADLRKTNEAGIEKDLCVLRLQVSRLTGIIKTLRPQTKQKLWNAPSFLDENGRQVRADINILLTYLLRDLATLDKVAESIKSKNEVATTPRGRTDDLRSAAATSVTAFYYRQLTGCEPSRSKAENGFLSLLQVVFSVLLIQRNVERATRDYLEKSRT